MSSLKVINADKVYHSGSLALYNINFEVKDREFIVVLGGEASGKSTLLRVIAGLEELSAGNIEIDGKDVTGADPKDRELAMVFRSNILNPSLSVYDNMAFGLKLRKAPSALIDGRVKTVAEMLGLNDVLYRKPKTLTAGQKQRVAIGRALVREPKLYLFDEPLSGLDGKLSAELLNVIINLQARMNGSFVYATKNVAEAMSIGSRIIVLKNGIIQQIDSPENLYDYPANAYVAFLIGSPTINFINSAEIVKDEEGTFVVKDALKIALTQKIIQRFESISEYINSGKKVNVGIRPEDAETSAEGFDAVLGKKENGYIECEVFSNPMTVRDNGKNKVKIDGDRLYLFDAETRLTLLARDGGYKQTGFAEADFKPLTFKEEEQVIEKYKPKKEAKKKR